MLLFLPLNKIWVVMLPSVTSSHPLSSQGADQAPCPAGAFSRGSWALPGAQTQGAPLCTPPMPLQRMHSSALQASAPRASVSLAGPPGMARGAPDPTHLLSARCLSPQRAPSPPVLSTSGAASSPSRLPKAQAQWPFTFIHVAPIPSWSGLLKFSPFSVAMVPGQPTTVLPLTLPTFSQATTPTAILHTGAWGSS